MPSALDATTNAQLRRPNLPLITLPWLACALVGLVMLMLGRFLGSYQETLIQQVGVFIIAAVSLNIVNGLTGQFSMGHAGFMALGAYVAAATTYYGSLLHFNTAQLQPGFFNFGHVLMLIGILAGALVAAIIFVLLPQVLHPIKDYRLVIFALLLIAMMLLRPKGLFGVREIWNILPRRAAPTKQGATP